MKCIGFHILILYWGMFYFINVSIFSYKNIIAQIHLFMQPSLIPYYVVVCFSDFHTELNAFPAETVAHLEAGQRRAATRLPGPDTVEAISVPVLHMAPCFRSMGEQFMLRISCL